MPLLPFSQCEPNHRHGGVAYPPTERPNRSQRSTRSGIDPKAHPAFSRSTNVREVVAHG